MTKANEFLNSISENIDYEFSIVDCHRDECFGYIHALQAGKKIGFIEFTASKEHQTGPWYTDDEGQQVADIIGESEFVRVGLIEVVPEFRRQGIATGMINKLKLEYPGAEIDYGMSVSAEGAGLMKKVK